MVLNSSLYCSVLEWFGGTVGQHVSLEFWLVRSWKKWKIASCRGTGERDVLLQRRLLLDSVFQGESARKNVFKNYFYLKIYFLYFKNYFTLTHQNNLKIQKNINSKKKNKKFSNFFKNTFKTQKKTGPKAVIKPSLWRWVGMFSIVVMVIF